MKILVENSTWNNVGDGWYQSALYNLLRQMYPNDEVIMGEGPIRRAFKIRNSRQKKNSYEMMEYQKADVHIFSGPMMKEVIGDYKSKIIEIKKRGAEYAFISVSGAKVEPSLLNEIGGFLQKYPPLFLSSRDEQTYKNFRSFVGNSYNGICTAFLVDKMLPLDYFEMDKPFFVSSFYRELEPIYSLLDQAKGATLGNIKADRKSTYLNLDFKYSRHLNFLRPKQESLGECHIVRLIQEINSRFNHINFALPNSFVSYNPLSSLNLIKSSSFVISDRVHACATALACNRPAQFLHETPRAGIFTRMGFDYKSNNGIMYPNLEIIDEELDKMTKAIRKAI